jgi:hypothetical protein
MLNRALLSPSILSGLAEISLFLTATPLDLLI